MHRSYSLYYVFRLSKFEIILLSLCIGPTFYYYSLNIVWALSHAYGGRFREFLTYFSVINEKFLIYFPDYFSVISHFSVDFSLIS